MLNVNLYRQSLITFSNIYHVSIAAFGHMWRSLRLIASPIPRAVCPAKAHTLHIVRALTEVCIFLEKPVPSEGHLSQLIHIVINYLFNFVTARRCPTLY